MDLGRLFRERLHGWFGVVKLESLARGEVMTMIVAGSLSGGLSLDGVSETVKYMWVTKPVGGSPCVLGRVISSFT